MLRCSRTLNPIRRGIRQRLAVLVGMLVLALVIPVGVASAYTRSFTYISCSYNVRTFSSGGHPVGQTDESDADCKSGASNVGVKMRWKTVSCPAGWTYSSIVKSEDLVQVVLVGSTCAYQTSGEARNAHPDSWSAWSSYG